MSEFTLTHFSILPPNYFSIDNHKSILQLLTLAAGETCTTCHQISTIMLFISDSYITDWSFADLPCLLRKGSSWDEEKEKATLAPWTKISISQGCEGWKPKDVFIQGMLCKCVSACFKNISVFNTFALLTLTKNYDNFM